MKLTSDTLSWLGWKGHENIALKIRELITMYLEENPDDHSGCVFLAAILRLKDFQVRNYQEWNTHVIPILNQLDENDFFGTEGWRHHVGLDD